MDFAAGFFVYNRLEQIKIESSFCDLISSAEDKTEMSLHGLDKINNSLPILFPIDEGQ